MRYFFMLFFALGTFIPGFTQNLYPLQVAADSLQFKVPVKNRQPSLEWASPELLFNAKRGDFPVVSNITLREGDLVVTYLPGKAKSSLSYRIDLGLRLPGGDSIAPQPYELAETPPPTGSKEQRQLVWQDFTEQLPDFDAPYTLFVRRSLMGAVNCAGERPAFTLQKQLPHYAAGAAGIVLIGLGQVYNQQKKDAYEQYQQAWAAGQSQEEAGSFFQTAHDKRNAAQACTYAGWALLGADALWYVFRHLKIRQRQKIYDKFCGQPSLSSLRLRPASVPQSPYPGLGISFTFSTGRP